MPVLRVTEFIRPNGERKSREVEVDQRTYDLAEKCLYHEHGLKFTMEYCGPFWNLCFEGLVLDGGDWEEVDLISEVVMNPTPGSWATVVDGACFCLDIDRSET